MRFSPIAVYHSLVAMDRKRKVMAALCLIYFLWHFGTNWTSTLLTFIQWDTEEAMTIVDVANIQAFGSVCNAIGSLSIGQIADTTGPKSIFLFASILTSVYFVGISFCRSWYSFFLLQVLRAGYILDASVEMYLATITTERERTSALMILTIPQAMAMFLAPYAASHIAGFSSLRTSQTVSGIAMGGGRGQGGGGVLLAAHKLLHLAMLIPVILLLLPSTHSFPRLASARLRPQDYWPMIVKNSALREGLILRTFIIAAYVCYELIGRNFILRAYTSYGAYDMAEVVMTMGASLIVSQFLILPQLQRRFSPKTLLQCAIMAMFLAYSAAAFVGSFTEYLIVVAIQTAGYAVAYAESSTQITSAVDMTDLGKATGFAAAIQWMSHIVVPIYTSHLVDHWHYTYAFYTSAILMLIMMVYVTLFAKSTNARLRTLLPNLVVT